MVAARAFETWWDWRGVPEPLRESSPAPMPAEQSDFRRRKPPERLSGRWDRACYSTWHLYCHVHGLDPSDADRMRKGLSRILGRPIASRSEISLDEWATATHEIDYLVARRDGEFHAQLFGHCPSLQSDRRLWPGAYAALHSFTLPCPLTGAELETWLSLLSLLLDHQEECEGGDGCSLLDEAVAIVKRERKSA